MRVKNRVHPDVRAADVTAETDRLIGLGASVFRAPCRPHRPGRPRGQRVLPVRGRSGRRVDRVSPAPR
ncbi:VOC family protein [Streptomyces sp. NPDC054833]